MTQPMFPPVDPIETTFLRRLDAPTPRNAPTPHDAVKPAERIGKMPELRDGWPTSDEVQGRVIALITGIVIGAAVTGAWLR